MNFSRTQILIVMVFGLILGALGLSAPVIYEQQIQPYGIWQTGSQHVRQAAEPQRQPKATVEQQAQPIEKRQEAAGREGGGGGQSVAPSAEAEGNAIGRASIRGGELSFVFAAVFGAIGALGAMSGALALNGSRKAGVITNGSRVVVDVAYDRSAGPEWRVCNVGDRPSEVSVTVWQGDRLQFMVPIPTTSAACAGRLRPGGELRFEAGAGGRFAVVSVCFDDGCGRRGDAFAVFEAVGGPVRLRKAGEGCRYA